MSVLDYATSDLAAIRERDDAPTRWQRIEHHTRTFDRAVRITQMADAKVAPVLALHVSLAAVTVTQAIGLGDGHGAMAAATGWALLLAYVALSMVATVYVAAVYVPTAPRRGAARTHHQSLFYFDDIQAMPVDEFEARSIRIDLAVAERDVIRQAHTVSRIASQKLVGVQRAFLFSALTLVAWLPLIVLQKG